MTGLILNKNRKKKSKSDKFKTYRMDFDLITQDKGTKEQKDWGP